MNWKRGLLIAGLTAVVMLAGGCATYSPYGYGYYDYWAPYPACGWYAPPCW